MNPETFTVPRDFLGFLLGGAGFSLLFVVMDGIKAKNIAKTHIITLTYSLALSSILSIMLSLGAFSWAAFIVWFVRWCYKDN